MPFSYSEPVFRPPAEAFSLILQLTEGCSHNKCRFCGMYKMKKFRIRDFEKIKKEIKMAPEALKLETGRIFLGDGDALVLGYEKLAEWLDILRENFPNLRRVAVYASPANILKLSSKQLEDLKNRKLSILYVGLESGHDPLLKFVNRGNSVEDFVVAVKMAREAGLKISVTAISGLGGRRFSKKHARDTARAINLSGPNYFSMLTLIPGGNENYLREIELMNRREILEELLEIIEGIEVKTIFRTNHASNVFDLGGTLPDDRNKLIALGKKILEERALSEYLSRVPQFAGEMSY